MQNPQIFFTMRQSGRCEFFETTCRITRFPVRKSIGAGAVHLGIYFLSGDIFFLFSPRPDPPGFFPPPSCLFTVAHARRAASFSESPRSKYPFLISAAFRSCLSVYFDVLLRGITSSMINFVDRQHLPRGIKHGAMRRRTISSVRLTIVTYRPSRRFI